MWIILLKFKKIIQTTEFVNLFSADRWRKICSHKNK